MLAYRNSAYVRVLQENLEAGFLRGLKAPTTCLLGHSNPD